MPQREKQQLDCLRMKGVASRRRTNPETEVAPERFRAPKLTGIAVEPSRDAAALEIDCDEYERLATLLAQEPADELQAAQLLQHEATCNGRHCEAALEFALGVEAGSLRNGSERDGVRSSAELLADIRSKL